MYHKAMLLFGSADAFALLSQTTRTFRSAFAFNLRCLRADTHLFN